MRRLFLLFIFLLLAVSLSAWNGTGHQAIAAAAWNKMSPSAQIWFLKTAGYDEALDAGKTKSQVIEGLAVWPDQVRGMMRWTAPWHYIGLPVTTTALLESDIISFRVAKTRKRMDVVSALRKQVIVLQTSEVPEVRRNALAFIVHFVGDIHQPLHCADDNDRGGNDKILRFRNRQMSLHELWDHSVSKDGDSSINLKKEVETELEALMKVAGPQLGAGTPEEWALDSNAHAVAIYAAWNEPEGKNLGMPYQEKWHPVAVSYQTLAALRLWLLLEQLAKGQQPVWR